MARQRWYTHPETGKLVTEEEYFRYKSENEPDNSSDHFSTNFFLKGNGFPSKKFSMEDRQKKALKENPNHTTMNDYKFTNPNSVPAKARRKNKRRLKKKNIEVKKYGE